MYSITSDVILNSTTIEFAWSNDWSDTISFNIDGKTTELGAYDIMFMFIKDEFADTCEAFINKLTNPVAFMDDEFVNNILDKFPVSLIRKANRE